jgi:hypothetical protein
MLFNILVTDNHYSVSSVEMRSEGCWECESFVANLWVLGADIGGGTLTGAFV